jgi:hypothetical protein
VVEPDGPALDENEVDLGMGDAGVGQFLLPLYRGQIT